MTVVPITSARSHAERPIRRAQLERAIGYGRSSIAAFIAEGMPTAGKDRRGRNLFHLTVVRAWLDVRNIDDGLAKTLERGTV